MLVADPPRPTAPVDAQSWNDDLPAAPQQWTYEEAFCRNLGLISREEQQILRNSRVAIAGMGGVGGVHLLTLARLGIGKFTIADPDVFEVANFNRQVGATTATLGRKKVEVMAEQARLINPELDIRTFAEPIDERNVEHFLTDADLFVDGIDFFVIEARRLLFSTARQAGIWALTAGPIGFSTAWILFDPRGMSFDDYFCMNSQPNYVDHVVKFAVGLTPRCLHLKYMDLSRVRMHSSTTPCSGLACTLSAGVVAAESVRILIQRTHPRPAPYYHQFDPFVNRYVSGKLRFGNRAFLQRLKYWWLRRRLTRMQPSEVS